jgi:hypothetical protein
MSQKSELIRDAAAARDELIESTHRAYEFAEAWAVEVLQDVEEAVDEEGIVLDQLVILGDLAGSEEPELGVDGVVLLGLGRHCW